MPAPEREPAAAADENGAGPVAAANDEAVGSAEPAGNAEPAVHAEAADSAEAAESVEAFLAGVEQTDRVAPLLLRVRQGAPAARKHALRQLAATPHVRALLELAVATAADAAVPDAERHRVVKLVSRVLLRSRPGPAARAVAALAEPLLRLSQTLLLEPDRIVRAMGQELLTSLARVVGLRALLAALRPHFGTADDRARLAAAVALAAVAAAFGVSLLLPLLRALTADTDANTRLLGLVALRRLPGHAPGAVLPFLGPLVACCVPALSEPHLSSAAGAALRALADAVAPFGIEAFEPALEPLWTGLRRRSGRPASAFLRTLATLVPLLDSTDAPEFVAPLLVHASRDYESRDDEIARTALRATQLCARAAAADDVAGLLPRLLDHFWTPRVAADRELAALAVHTAAALPLDFSRVVVELVGRNVLVSDSADVQAMALDLLARLELAPLLLDRRMEERLVDGLLAAPPVLAAVRAAAKVAQALGPERLAVHARAWVQALIEQQAHPDAALREFSARIISALARELPQPELRGLQRHLVEQLGEEYPDVLAQILTALTAVIAAVTGTPDPPVSTLLPRVSPILRNRNEAVQEACIRLITLLAETGGDSVSAREWINVCFELLQLQSSHRITVRRLATSTFSTIASIIGPQDVVISLLGQLRSNDRQLRVTSAAAIAAVGAQTGPFTVLPIVLNEYRSQAVVVQHGVLKTLAFLFEFVEEGQAADYVDSLVTLIDHALLQQNQVHRQTAATIVQHLALGCVGRGKEAIFIHFLNELMPSIFETSPHVIDRVLEAIEAIHLVIGTPAMVNYLWAGLFHSARKVRTAYWRIWNLLYVHNSDALVPVYPVHIPSMDDASLDVRDVWV